MAKTVARKISPHAEQTFRVARLQFAMQGLKPRHLSVLQSIFSITTDGAHHITLSELESLFNALASADLKLVKSTGGNTYKIEFYGASIGITLHPRHGGGENNYIHPIGVRQIAEALVRNGLVQDRTAEILSLERFHEYQQRLGESSAIEPPKEEDVASNGRVSLPIVNPTFQLDMDRIILPAGYRLPRAMVSMIADPYWRAAEQNYFAAMVAGMAAAVHSGLDQSTYEAARVAAQSIIGGIKKGNDMTIRSFQHADIAILHHTLSVDASRPPHNIEQVFGAPLLRPIQPPDLYKMAAAHLQGSVVLGYPALFGQARALLGRHMMAALPVVQKAPITVPRINIPAAPAVSANSVTVSTADAPAPALVAEAPPIETVSYKSLVAASPAPKSLSPHPMDWCIPAGYTLSAEFLRKLLANKSYKTKLMHDLVHLAGIMKVYWETWHKELDKKSVDDVRQEAYESVAKDCSKGNPHGHFSTDHLFLLFKLVVSLDLPPGQPFHILSPVPAVSVEDHAARISQKHGRQLSANRGEELLANVLLVRLHALTSDMKQTAEDYALDKRCVDVDMSVRPQIQPEEMTAEERFVQDRKRKIAALTSEDSYQIRKGDVVSASLVQEFLAAPTYRRVLSRLAGCLNMASDFALLVSDLIQENPDDPDAMDNIKQSGALTWRVMMEEQGFTKDDMILAARLLSVPKTQERDGASVDDLFMKPMEGEMDYFSLTVLWGSHPIYKKMTEILRPKPDRSQRILDHIFKTRIGWAVLASASSTVRAPAPVELSAAARRQLRELVAAR